jgi:hypothetical protein
MNVRRKKFLVDSLLVLVQLFLICNYPFLALVSKDIYLKRSLILFFPNRKLFDWGLILVEVIVVIVEAIKYFKGFIDVIH